MNHKWSPGFLEPIPSSGDLPEVITSGWQSPSNIALVKYWGKLPGQIPLTPSLSMTLSACFTRTVTEAVRSDRPGAGILINGSAGHPFLPKMKALLTFLSGQIPVLARYRYSVTTQNSFPHSAGIASSASGLSAFALCLLGIAEKALRICVPAETFLRDASCAARMGSGSAARSVYGGWVAWGQTNAVDSAADTLAVSVTHLVHPLFQTLRDTILVVSGKPKSLSSSEGHMTMLCHPFTEGRIMQAKGRFIQLLEAIKAGDLPMAGMLAEAEALTLHALLMTTPGGDILIEPGTLEIIRRIRKARNDGLPIFFSIDAGPNVHLLHPEEASTAVRDFCATELLPFCENGLAVNDGCGRGPFRIDGVAYEGEGRV